MDEDGPLRLEGRRWAIPSMLWVNKECGSGANADRIPGSDSGDHPVLERVIFMASVYVEGGDASALDDACDRLIKVITKVPRDTGTVVETMIVGDWEETMCPWEGRVKRIQSSASRMNLLSAAWHGGGQSGD